ncbi:hypothetical protein ACGC1H_005005 [Rhizoctonia solani]
MRSALFGILSVVGISWGFNINASAIRAAEAAKLDETPHFGNIAIPGQMEPTDLVFPDGLRLLLYSPNAQNVSVEKKDQPSAPARFVTPLDSAAVSLGSGFWAAIYNHSWTIAFEAKNVDDLVATIEVSYDSGILESLSIKPENTFLGRFDSGRGGWVVDTSRSSVDSTHKKTRIIGLPNLDGEYMLLGRKSINSHGNFIQPGSSSNLSDFMIEDPPVDSQGQTDPSKAPIQVGTWIDGFQLEVRSCTKMRVNMNFFNSSEVKIQEGFKARLTDTCLIPQRPIARLRLSQGYRFARPKSKRTHSKALGCKWHSSIQPPESSELHPKLDQMRHPLYDGSNSCLVSSKLRGHLSILNGF